MAVTLLQQIWENRIVGPVTYPVTYARSAIAMAPAKVGELYAVSSTIAKAQRLVSTCGNRQLARKRKRIKTVPLHLHTRALTFFSPIRAPFSLSHLSFPPTPPRPPQSREAFFKSIEAAMEKFKTSAVALPAELPAAIAAAIAEARSNLGSTHLFGKVRAAYDAVLKYPAVVSFIERTAPMAAKAVDLAAPYYASAKDLATPYVTKVVEVAEPYVAAIKGKVWADASSPAEAQ
jgi:hypothetical protein